jgi:uncharacterized phage infection (PIP) family protein YhgE
MQTGTIHLARVGRRKAAVLIGLTACLVPATRAYAQNSTHDQLDGTRAALDKWVETRRILSKEKQDWELGKEMLSDRVQVVKQEITSLKGKISDAEKSTAEADKKRAELADENEKLKQASASLSSTIAGLESRTKQLLQRVPDVLRERLRDLSKSIPEKPEETKLSLNVRYMNVVGILNEIDKFNREISTSTEVRKLPDGTSVEVTTLYIGLGQAYYASTNGKAAGVGVPSAQGWAWTPANESAAQIQKAIAVFKNEQVAAFVPLPVHIN